MGRRAAIFTQSDLDRAAKAAARVRYVVEIRPGVVRLVPPAEPGKNSPIDDDGAAEWDAALQ